MSGEKTFDRREFFRNVLTASSAIATSSFVFGLMPTRETALQWHPRPPGALAGVQFTSACARCGQCVEACPYNALRLSTLQGPTPLGTPYFVPRESPCRMCRDLPCVKACPTGALNPTLEDIRQAKMGVAVIDPNACISWQGLRCEVCFRECPENGRAITIAPHPRGLSKHAVFAPTIHPEACTGCGLCEKGCPMDQPAIRVSDPSAVLGAIGRHYRLGWLPGDDPKNTRREVPPPERLSEIPTSDNSVQASLDYLNAEDP